MRSEAHGSANVVDGTAFFNKLLVLFEAVLDFGCKQDIKMLHPGEVNPGKEHKDLCVHLRDDIRRTHRE
jgi:hypothetical protein